ncbi:cysteine hydrolase family protein [Clostridium sp. DJ247]|uniref:cysteine hydrolase family protein n=1 Tax=Clostridium sp. DJ247 TaxID=2726188 RepID=UPI001625D249|nr:isochorismatase family cysteine hydrolase [Clostridium sp. DJ247]MBC2581105.1 cysteine hydrolase [Clostridium sp. DJ247]
MISKDEFLNRSSSALEEIYDMINDSKTINIKDLEPNNTALIIVDMINGFVREGMLKSSRVEGIIPDIINISKACDELGMAKIAFADSHTEASPEFHSYPVHCIRGTSEEQIVDEIKKVGGYKLISKNSANGFLEEEFQLWLAVGIYSYKNRVIC